MPGFAIKTRFEKNSVHIKTSFVAHTCVSKRDVLCVSSSFSRFSPTCGLRILFAFHCLGPKTRSQNLAFFAQNVFWEQ